MGRSLTRVRTVATGGGANEKSAIYFQTVRTVYFGVQESV